MGLRDKPLCSASLKELIAEITLRGNVRDMNIEEDETYKLEAHGENKIHERYMRGQGKAIVLEIKL